MRIGELLTQAGVVSEDQLKERLSAAKSAGLPFGKTLVDAGHLTSYQLLGTVQVQSLLLDGRLSSESAILAVHFICRENFGLDDALRKVGPLKDQSGTCKLGELLVESGAITQMDLFTGLANSFESCMPLGVALVQRKVVTQNVIQAALTLQAAARAGKITRGEAIVHLRAILGNQGEPLPADDTPSIISRHSNPPVPAAQGGYDPMDLSPVSSPIDQAVTADEVLSPTISQVQPTVAAEAVPAPVPTSQLSRGEPTLINFQATSAMPPAEQPSETSPPALSSESGKLGLTQPSNPFINTPRPSQLVMAPDPHRSMGGLSPRSTLPPGEAPTDQSVRTTLDDLRGKSEQAYASGKFSDAERFLAAALKESERLGEESKQFIQSLIDMADFYVKRGELSVAQSLMARAVVIASRFLQVDDPLLLELKRKIEWVRLRRSSGGTEGLNWIP